jgi:hypothetical protein
MIPYEASDLKRHNSRKYKKNQEIEMKGMKSMKKSVIFAALMVIVCATLIPTVSATTFDFGKSNQLFSQTGGFSQILVNAGNNDVMKAGFYQAYPATSFALIKPQANSPYFRKLNAFSATNYSTYLTTLPVSYPTITPVPEQGSSNSTLGGLIIRGVEDGDLINIRSNFFDASTGPTGIYNGKWHYNYWTVPVYWENQVLPGSYTIQIANKDSGVVYYCETVTVSPGQTTVIQANNSLCPFCSSC